MYLLNRTALLVKPKQPYVNWANSLGNDGPRVADPDDLREEHTVYLVDEIFGPAEQEALIESYCDTIFEQELAGWHLLESDWPKQRDFKTFLEWFEVEVHSMVMDLSDYDLELETFDMRLF